MRGIVVSKLINVTRYGMSLQSELDPQSMRMWLLHWDKLEYPISIMSNSLSPDEQFLLESGVMQRTIVNDIYQKSDKSDQDNGGLFDSTIDTFRYLDKQAPGTWAIARTKLPDSPWDHLDQPRTFEQNDNSRGLYIRLISAIPVPEKDIPLAEIIAFKDRRQSELLAFRSYIDEMYQDILQAPDRPLAELTSLDRLQKSVKDITSSKPIFSWKFLDLSGKFNLVNASAAAIVAHSAGLGLLPTMAAAAATAAIEIGPSFGLRDSKKSNIPFEYIARYYREL